MFGVEVESAGTEADNDGNDEVFAIGGQGKTCHKDGGGIEEEFERVAINPQRGAVQEKATLTAYPRSCRVAIPREEGGIGPPERDSGWPFLCET